MDDIELDDFKSLALYRKEEILKLNYDVIILNDMFSELNYIITSQDQNLDFISENLIDKSKNRIDEAYKNLIYAKLYQNKNKLLFSTLLVSPTVGILFGIKAGLVTCIGMLSANQILK